MLEQKKFRVTEQTLATLKLCNNIELLNADRPTEN